MINSGAHTSGGVAREPLDRVWNEAMLSGDAIHWDEGEMRLRRPARQLPNLPGILIFAGPSQGGISVADQRGSRMFGLVRGVGWSMNGGMLAHARAPETMLELFGKRVVRWNGGFLGLDAYHGLEDESYEFFLLLRPATGGRAHIIEQWAIPAQDVDWKFGGETDKAARIANARSDVRGALTFDAATKTAVVSITGLKHPFERRVQLPQSSNATAK